MLPAAAAEDRTHTAAAAAFAVAGADDGARIARLRAGVELPAGRDRGMTQDLQHRLGADLRAPQGAVNAVGERFRQGGGQAGFRGAEADVLACEQLIKRLGQQDRPFPGRGRCAVHAGRLV